MKIEELQRLGVTPDVDEAIAFEEHQDAPEFSVLAGYNNGNPIIDARRATTVVRIANQHTLVIGGLRQKTMVETVRGIPGLMKMKYVGRFFSTHNTEMRESELIVFLQPEIDDEHITGLPREQIALDNERIQLSRIPYSTIGTFVPDCKDPNCPSHHLRCRVNGGLPDEGQVMPAGFVSGTSAVPAVQNTERPPENYAPPEFDSTYPLSNNAIPLGSPSDQGSSMPPSSSAPTSLPLVDPPASASIIHPVSAFAAP